MLVNFLIEMHIELPSADGLRSLTALVRYRYSNLNKFQLVNILTDPLVVRINNELVVDPALSFFDYAWKLCVLLTKINY